jgi:DNA primase
MKGGCNLVNDKELNEKINKLAEKVDIANFIKDKTDINLISVGKNYKANCPFCDKEKCFTINPENQFYYCFICESGGNIFTFTQKYFDIKFVQALKKVKKYAES